MRLVYLFTSHGCASPDTTIKWDVNARTENMYAEYGFPTDGMYSLCELLLARKIVSEVLVFVESTISPGTLKYKEGFTCYTIPSIMSAIDMLHADDILFVRGGFRSWFPFLTAVCPGHWTLFYRAASNRNPWPFWDVILEDLIEPGASYVDQFDRVHLEFNKPVNSKIFFPMPRFSQDNRYDLCIGASHVHDKKGQWRTVNALEPYSSRYGTSLCCILPGGLRRGEKTNAMVESIRTNKLNVKLVGMLNKDVLREVYNASSMFIHLGGAGQNDRGVLESLACGTPVMLANVQYHAPFTYDNERFCYVTHSAGDPEKLAIAIHTALEKFQGLKPEVVHDYYEKRNGLAVVQQQMDKLFTALVSTQIKNRAELAANLNIRRSAQC